MEVVTERFFRCPECTGIFKPSESTSVFTVGDCPYCKKNIRPEVFNVFVKRC